ncbi:MAG: class I SAM-dependent methyltransferase [Desulfobacteraceae bacterium]|nr:class I SAM-dependent methyltransferase [Desulfobacteraceae bacterium]
MKNNIHQKKLYKDLYERGEFTVWSHDDDENDYKLILGRLGDDWIRYQTALDIGCGTGKYSVCLAQMGFKSVLGIDFVEIAISEAKKQRESNLQFTCSDLFKLDLNKEFGLFFDRGVFTHLERKLLKRYLDTLDSIGAENYRILFTCFAEDYYLTEGQKNKKAFYHNGLFFRKYIREDLLHVLNGRFRILELNKAYKSNNRVFWHLLAERKRAA